MADDFETMYEIYINKKNKNSFYCNAIFVGLCIFLCLCASLSILLAKDKIPETEDEKVARETFKAAVVEYAVVVPEQCSKVALWSIL